MNEISFRSFQSFHTLLFSPPWWNSIAKEEGEGRKKLKNKIIIIIITITILDEIVFVITIFIIAN